MKVLGRIGRIVLITFILSLSISNVVKADQVEAKYMRVLDVSDAVNWGQVIAGGLCEWKITNDGVLVINAEADPLAEDSKRRLDDDYRTANFISGKNIVKKAQVHINGYPDLSYLFAGLENLEEVEFIDCDFSNAKTMKAMFQSCPKLKSVDMSMFTLGKVETVRAMFQNCTSLETVKLCKLTGGCVTDMNQLFYGCKSLKSTVEKPLDLSVINATNVTNMYGMFGSCSSIEYINLNSVLTGKVTNISRMFNECSSLERVDFNNCDFSSVEDMSSLFYNCSKLKEVKFNPDIAIDKVENANSMFKWCKNIENIDMSAVNLNYCMTSSSSLLGLEECNSLKVFDTPINVSMFQHSKLPYRMHDDDEGNVHTEAPHCTYSKHLESFVFDIKKDGWKTRNTHSNFSDNYFISDTDKKLLLEGLSNTEIATLGLQDEWEGHCFGMASAALMLWDNTINLKDFDAGYECPGDVNKLKKYGSTYSMLTFYFFRQKIGELMAYRTSHFEAAKENLDGNNEKENIIGIIDELKGGKPVLLSCILKKWINTKLSVIGIYDGVKYSKHAVIAHDMVESSKDPGTYYFYVYDNMWGNNYSDDYLVKAWIKGDDIGWECPELDDDWNSYYEYDDSVGGEYTLDKGRICFAYAVSIDKLKEDGKLLLAPGKATPRNSAENILTEGVGEDASEKVWMITEADNFTISDGLKEFAFEDGEEKSDSLFVETYAYEEDLYSEKNRRMFCIPKLQGDEDNYTITVEEGNASDIVLYNHNPSDGFYISVSAPTSGSIKINKNGDVVTEFGESVNHTVKVTRNNTTTDWYTTAVSTKSTGMTVSVEDNKTKIKTNEAGKATISANGLFTKVEIPEVDVNTTPISVEEENEHLLVVKNNEGEVLKSVEFGRSVIFDSQGGSDVDSILDVTKGNTIAEPAVPSKTGYIFTGWYKDRELSSKWNFSTDTVENDLVLYAGWRVDDNRVNVSFVVRGENKAVLNVEKNSLLVIEDCPENVISEDKNWYKDEACVVPWNFETDKASADLTLYGRGPLYTVNFVTGTDDAIESIKVEEGKLIQKPEKNPKKDGYTFIGWSETTDDTLLWDFDSFEVTGNMTLYAVWSENANNDGKEDSEEGENKENSNEEGDKGNQEENQIAWGEVLPEDRPLDGVLPERLWAVGFENTEYTGYNVTFADMRVYYGNVLLKKNTDYIVKYSNNKKVGTNTAIITITGKGNYKGAKKYKFSILPKKTTGTSISKSTVLSWKKTVIYSGESISQNAILKLRGNELKANQDYTVTYYNNVNVGTATVLYRGIGDYKGVIRKTFKISPLSIAGRDDIDCKYEANVAVPYTMGGAKPEIVVTYKNKELKAGTDYTVAYKNNNRVGNATFVIKGKGNFKGISRAYEFAVEPQDISLLSIRVPDVSYKNRTKIYKSKPIITDVNGKVISLGKDYSSTMEYTYINDTMINGELKTAGTVVSNTDIIPVGTQIRVKVTGIKKYNKNSNCIYGEFRFIDSSKDISKAQITVNAKKYYTGKPVTFDKNELTVTLGGELSGNSYEIVKYSNNIKCGTATAVIHGTGEYGGYKTIKFKILPANVE